MPELRVIEIIIFNSIQGGVLKMNEQHNIGCMSCKHNNFDGGCVAFPKVIPFRFTAGQPHIEPTPDQGNDIVYEWIDRVEQRARMKNIIADRKAQEALLSSGSL
jgi:hypothetical protein